MRIMFFYLSKSKLLPISLTLIENCLILLNNILKNKLPSNTLARSNNLPGFDTFQEPVTFKKNLHLFLVDKLQTFEWSIIQSLDFKFFLLTLLLLMTKSNFACHVIALFVIGFFHGSAVFQDPYLNARSLSKFSNTGANFAFQKFSGKTQPWKEVLSQYQVGDPMSAQGPQKIRKHPPSHSIFGNFLPRWGSLDLSWSNILVYNRLHYRLVRCKWLLSFIIRFLK